MRNRNVLMLMMVLFVAGVGFADSPVTGGLVKHVDASALTGLNDGDSVSVWPDLAGYDDMVTYAGLPTYVTGVINGLPVVRFNGDGGLVASTEAGHFSGDQAHTVFMVAIGEEYAGSGVALWQIGRDGSGLYSAFTMEGSAAIGCRMGNGWNKFVPNPEHSLGVADIFAIKYPGGNYTNYALDVNGTAASNATNQPNNKMSMDNSTIRVGNRDNKTPSFNGDIAEVLVFNCELSASAENEVGYYLATKYGLTSSYSRPTFYLLDHSPTDGAGRVGQDIQLSWKAHAADSPPTYTVYLGTEPNDVNPVYSDGPVAITQDTFYAPQAALLPNTLYYWSVSAITDANSADGDVLTFTTGGDIANLSPDGTTGLSPDGVTISWAADSAGSTYIDGYNVYLGETLPETPTVTVTENEWTVSGLTGGTTYQCKVESMHDGSPVSEATVSFTTGKLVGHWPFDGDLTELVSGNDGTRGEPENYSEGIIDDGLSVEFYGDNPVVVPTTGVDSGSSWTISCWEFSNPDAGGNGVWETMIGCGADDAGWGVFEFGRLDVKQYVLGFGNDYKYTPNDDSYKRGEWHFHVISYDAVAKTISWYINGVLANLYSNHTEVLDVELSIGNVRGLSQAFTGKIDDLKLYNLPLNADQVLDEYVNGVGGAPILPVPASGTRNVAWDLSLDWVASASATSHTIEIGKAGDLSDATTIALEADVSSFDVASGLGYNLDVDTEYFWRITSTIDGEDVFGPIWFFEVRDLVGDVNGDSAVDLGDVKDFAGVWLEDSSVYPPSEYAYLDHESWSPDPNFPVDPVLSDYASPWAADSVWGWGEMTLNLEPTLIPATPPDPNYDPGSQTIVWRYNKEWVADGQPGSNGTDVGITLYLPVHVDFTQFDKFGFWVYQENCAGSADIRIDDQGGSPSGGYSQKIYQAWYNIGSFNGDWHKYEWDIPADSGATDVGRIRFYRGQSGSGTAIEEFSNFFLVKDDLEVKICMNEHIIHAEDLNSDCMVNLLDLAIMAENWMLDASN